MQEKKKADPMDSFLGYNASTEAPSTEQLMAILRNLNLRIRDLEDQVEDCEHNINELERKIDHLEEDLEREKYS